MRASIVEVQTALNLGYNSDNDRKFGHRFNKGTRIIYGILAGERKRPAWRTEDLIDGAYCNHQDFAKLIDALARPIEVFERVKNDKIVCRRCDRHTWHIVWRAGEGRNVLTKCHECKSFTRINPLRRDHENKRTS